MEDLDVNQKKCTFCGETIDINAGRCPYCCSLQESTDQSYIPAPYSAASVPETAILTHAEEVQARAVRRNSGSMSNASKVFTAVLCTLVPGIGQLAGIIISILLMNNEEDEDKRTYGIALLAASLVVFVLTCAFYFLLLLAFVSRS